MFGRRISDQEPLAHRLFGKTLGAVVLFVVEVAQVLVIALAIILPVRWFLIMPFIVKGASMEPNFYDNEYLIIDELSFDFREVERGEIVVFHPPTSDAQYYIKRVIGLPGEKIQIVDGKVMIYNDAFPNGFALEESYIEEYTYGRTPMIELGDGEYYVMGDNRDKSLDSRVFGPITQDHITGRVWIRGLPFDRAATFTVPEYVTETE